MHNPDSEIVSSERTFFKIICNITITFCQRWQILICDYRAYSTAEAFFSLLLFSRRIVKDLHRIFALQRSKVSISCLSHFNSLNVTGSREMWQKLKLHHINF